MKMNNVYLNENNLCSSLDDIMVFINDRVKDTITSRRKKISNRNNISAAEAEDEVSNMRVYGYKDEKSGILIFDKLDKGLNHK